MAKRKRSPAQRQTEQQISLLALFIFILITAIWLVQMMQPAPPRPIAEAPVTPQPMPTSTPLSERLRTPAPPPVTVTVGCDATELHAAVATADHVIIDCTDPIVLQQPLILPHTISISGMNPQQAILSGNRALDALLVVEPDVDLTLFNVHLTEARIGIYLKADTTLSAIDCTLNYLGQPDGTTIANHGTRVYLRDCLLEHNTGDSVLFNPQTGVLEIDDSMIRENAIQGESPLMNYGRLIIKNTIFRSNEGINGGAIANRGHVTVQDSSFTDNNALEAGGAIYNSRRATATLSRSSFRDNRAERGAAIYNTGHLTVEYLSLTSNRRDCVNLPGARLIDPQRICY